MTTRSRSHLAILITKIEKPTTMTSLNNDKRATHARTMRFEKTPTGCFIPVSHRTNQDGYLYKTWVVDGRTQKEAFHRFIYRAHHDILDWPAGYEIDHICRIRSCCNPDHLRMIGRSEHARYTNTYRYQDRHETARRYWLATKCNGTKLAKRYVVTTSTGCRWIRGWKANPDTYRSGADVSKQKPTFDIASRSIQSASI